MSPLKRTFAEQLKTHIDAVSASYTSRKGPIQHELDLTIGEVRWDWSMLNSALCLSPSDLRYQDPRGAETLRSAYLDKATILPIACSPLTPANVLVCAGGKQAMYLAMHSVIRPGDRILVPCPGWPPYAIWANSLGAETVRYDACDQNADGLIAALRKERCKHVVLNSPNNPTGVELTCLAIHEIVRQASLHGVSILSDEVYRPFSALRSSFLPFVGEADTPVIVVDSASKWLAAAGLRIGFLVANEKLINSALMIRGTIDSCPSGPSQAVTALMLSDFAAETRTAIRQFVRTRVQGFVDLLTSEGISPKHSGGLFVWLSAKDPVLPWNDLEGRVLSGVSGAAFGMPGHVRFCPTCISDETAQYLGLEAWRPLEES